MRFISEDTNKGDVKDPLSLNLYTYCVGNPVIYFDASGNAPDLINREDTGIASVDPFTLIDGGIRIAKRARLVYKIVNTAERIINKIINKGAGNPFTRNLKGVNELDANAFNNLKDNGIVKVNSSGSDRPLTGTANSYYKTANGEHVFVYDGDGKLIYDLSTERVKSFKINVNLKGEEFYQAYKLKGNVPDFIKNMFGW